MRAYLHDDGPLLSRMPRVRNFVSPSVRECGVPLLETLLPLVDDEAVLYSLIPLATDALAMHESMVAPLATLLPAK